MSSPKQKKNYLDYAFISAVATCERLSLDPRAGLDTAVAARLLAQYGPNEISRSALRWYHIFFRQCRSPFIYLLLFAALLTFLLGERIDAAVIILFVLINVLLGFYQEYRSEETVRLLRAYTLRRAKVRRSSSLCSIYARDLVPGDLVIVSAGDIVPADLRLISDCQLEIDESVLTGESVPVKKSAACQPSAEAAVHEIGNICFAGSKVISGEGEGIVVASGDLTFTGAVNSLALATHHQSTFEKGISLFSIFILKLISITLLFVFIANILIKGASSGILDFLIFSIALAVSVIPEALPAVTTFSFSRGAHRLSQLKVIVRRLSAVEDLGSIDVLCTDKTGTLTENKMRVASLLAKNSRETLALAYLAGETGSQAVDSFDQSIAHELAHPLKQELSALEVVARMPFDPLRRRSSALVRRFGKIQLITRGAPETIFDLCRDSAPYSRRDLDSWLKDQGLQGRRVLAVAEKILPGKSAPDIASAEKNLSFAGLISFEDPLKKTASAAISQARKLGIKIKIITGDSPEVSSAVGKAVGLINNDTEVISGAQFTAMSPAEQQEAAENFSVFARVNPAQKYHLIETLQKKHEVGYLGEGINDAPALKIANVSLVVQGASDIARESADIVLLDSSLNVIINGIREGRTIFGNTVKYIKATLTSNFGNFYAVAVASLLVPFLPMLPLQLLLLNLLSDFPMIAIATDNIDPAELKKPRSYELKEITLFALVLGLVSAVFDFIFFGLFQRFGPSVLQTNWFMASVLTELMLIFSLRAHGPFYRSKKPSRPLLLLTIPAALLTLLLPYTNFGRQFFSFTPPSPAQVVLIIIVALIYLLVTEIVKLSFYRLMAARDNHLSTHPIRH